MLEYKVKQGDCINSIAFKHGFFWETLWNHPKNAKLNLKRKDPSVLQEGDIVYIPDLTIKEESGTTEQRHKFRLKGVPAKIKIRLCVDDQPRMNEPFILYVDDVEVYQGNTDGDGYVRAAIPPNAKKGKILVGSGDEQDVFVFLLGTVDPIETDEGVRGRLYNMGYDVSDLTEAIRNFQSKENLNITGIADVPTLARLKERFGQ